MYQLIFSNSFKKNYKLMQKRNYDMDLLSIVFAQLINTENVASKYKPDKLTGDFEGFWECHVKPDWLLVWAKNEPQRTITLHYTAPIAPCFKHNSPTGLAYARAPFAPALNDKHLFTVIPAHYGNPLPCAIKPVVYDRRFPPAWKWH